MPTTRELTIDETFDRAYDVEWLFDLPNSRSIDVYYVPNGKPNSGPLLHKHGEDPRDTPVLKRLDLATGARLA